MIINVFLSFRFERSKSSSLGLRDRELRSTDDRPQESRLHRRLLARRKISRVRRLRQSSSGKIFPICFNAFLNYPVIMTFRFCFLRDKNKLAKESF